MCGSRSGPPPPEKAQNIGFSSNTCPDPLKNRSCETSIQWWAFRWRADGGPLKVGLGSSLPSSTLKTNVVKVGSPLTKPSGSAHESCPSIVKFQSSRFTRTACMRGSRTFVRGHSFYVKLANCEIRKVENRIL